MPDTLYYYALVRPVPSGLRSSVSTVVSVTMRILAPSSEVSSPIRYEATIRESKSMLSCHYELVHEPLTYKRRPFTSVVSFSVHKHWLKKLGTKSCKEIDWPNI